MELALIAIIIAAIVLLLQIVSIAQITGIRRSLGTPRDGRPAPMQHGDRFEKRNQDFRRHERRPFSDQNQRPQQHASPAPVDPVEKSLRDINLRLKSAERDQESARRRMQEGFPRGDNNRHRDDHGRGGNRDRDRNYNRDHRRDNWQDRNRSGGFQQQQPAPAAPQQPRSEPVVEKKPVDLPAPEPQAPVQQIPPQDLQETIVSDFNADQNLQHGRKIIVKRRTLKDESAEETSAESTSVEETPARAAAAPLEHKEEDTKIDPGPEVNLNGGIKFGRR